MCGATFMARKRSEAAADWHGALRTVTKRWKKPQESRNAMRRHRRVQSGPKVDNFASSRTTRTEVRGYCSRNPARD